MKIKINLSPWKHLCTHLNWNQNILICHHGYNYVIKEIDTMVPRILLSESFFPQSFGEANLPARYQPLKQVV